MLGKELSLLLDKTFLPKHFSHSYLTGTFLLCGLSLLKKKEDILNWKVLVWGRVLGGGLVVCCCCGGLDSGWVDRQTDSGGRDMTPRATAVQTLSCCFYAGGICGQAGSLSVWYAREGKEEGTRGRDLTGY